MTTGSSLRKLRQYEIRSKVESEFLMKSRRKVILGIAAVVAVIGLAGCGNSQKQDSSATQTSQKSASDMSNSTNAITTDAIVKKLESMGFEKVDKFSDGKNNELVVGEADVQRSGAKEEIGIENLNGNGYVDVSIEHIVNSDSFRENVINGDYPIYPNKEDDNPYAGPLNDGDWFISYEDGGTYGAVLTDLNMFNSSSAWTNWLKQMDWEDDD